MSNQESKIDELIKMASSQGANIHQLIKQGDVVNSKIDSLQEKAVEQAMTAKAAHKRIDDLKDHIDTAMEKLNKSVDAIDGNVKKNTTFRENAQGAFKAIVFIIGLIGTGIGALIAKFF